MEQTEETPFDRAREKSTKSVIEAEKFKAVIGQPNALFRLLTNYQ